MRNQKIISRVVLAVVLCEILIQGVVFFFISKKVSATLESHDIEELQVIAKDRSQIVELYIDNYINLVQAYAKDPVILNAILNPNDKAAIKAAKDYTEDFSKDVESLDGFFVADWEETKIFVASNEMLIGEYVRTGSARQMIKDRMKDHYEPFCYGIGKASGEHGKVMVVLKAMQDSKGNVVGIVGGSIFLDKLQKELEKQANNGVSGVKYVLIDANISSYIFSDKGDIPGSEIVDDWLKKVLMEQRIGSGEPYRTYNEAGMRYIDVYSYIKGVDWLFVVSTSMEDNYATTTKILISMMLMFVGAVFVVVLLTVAGLNRGLKPLSIIGDSIDKIKVNSFDFEEEEDFKKILKRDDDYGNVARLITSLGKNIAGKNEIFSELLKAQSSAFVALDVKTWDIVLINEAAHKLLGVEGDVLSEGDVREIFEEVGEYNTAVLRDIIDTVVKTGSCSKEVMFTHKDGRDIYVFVLGKCVTLSNNSEVLMLSASDITERKIEEKQKNMQTFIDETTGLLDEQSGITHIERKLKDQIDGMFMLLSVDRFSKYVEEKGEKVGELVIQSITNSMRQTFRGNDILIHIKDDRFAVFVSGVLENEVCNNIIRRLFNLIEAAEINKDDNTKFFIRIGAVRSNKFKDYEGMVKRAEGAMKDCSGAMGNSYFLI
ncbi:MAG: diguanylate cyclase [Lachnospiraceae bacterium]|nr:diguanylate cyclase [Lachnospiraceae bacterium]